MLRSMQMIIHTENWKSLIITWSLLFMCNSSGSPVVSDFKMLHWHLDFSPSMSGYHPSPGESHCLPLRFSNMSHSVLPQGLSSASLFFLHLPDGLHFTLMSTTWCHTFKKSDNPIRASHQFHLAQYWSHTVFTYPFFTHIQLISY